MIFPIEAWALFFLLLKHAVADLGLQGYIVGRGKYYYFDSKLWMHSLHHGLATWFVLCFFTDIQTAFLVGVLDIFLHWQIDFAKTRYLAWRQKKANTREFWWIQGLDQFLHYCCYFLYVWIIN